MRKAVAYTLTAIILSLPTAFASQYSPFLLPINDQVSEYRGLIDLKLFHRDSKCANDCSSMNSMACCPKDTNCALDGAGNIACCPHDAQCTGMLGAPGAVSTPSATSESGTSAASTAAITHAISGSSTVSNTYYPFPYLPTTYPNAAICTSSYSSCQLESAKCTGVLEGGGMAVTISAPGGGVTQQGAIAPASAESICSSLSAEACHGLALTQCSSLGGGSSTAAAGTFVVGSANAAPTGCMMLYRVGVGMAVGLAGQAIG